METYKSVSLTCWGMCEIHNHGSGLWLVEWTGRSAADRRMGVLVHSSPFCRKLNWMRGKHVDKLTVRTALATQLFQHCGCHRVDFPDDDDPRCVAAREMPVRVPVSLLATLPCEWWFVHDQDEE